MPRSFPFALLLVLVVATCFISVRPAFGSADIISRIMIKGYEPVSEQQIRNVLVLKEGESYSPEAESKSLELLRAWSRFDAIKITKQASSSGWIITVDLVPGLIISSIEFSGHFPYLTSRIRRNVGLHVGEVYQREEIIKEVKKIKRFFEREGYFTTTVRVKEKVDDEKGVVIIHFYIRKGARLRWGNIYVEGNRALSDGYYRSRINAWLPYKPGRLRESLDKLREAYKRKGYPRARIRTKKIERDFEKGRVNIWFKASEHSHLSVKFIGNRRIKRKTLLETMTFFREEAYDAYEVRQSIRELERLYRRTGFLDVQIKAERRDIAPGKIQVKFLITEGPQTLVKDIRITGEQPIKEKNIKKDLRLSEAGFFTPGYLSRPALDRDRRAMPRLLRREGYPKAELTETRVKFNQWHDRATVEFHVKEGTQAIVRDITFSGVNNISPKALRKEMSLKKDRPFNNVALQDDALRIQNYYTDHGYPYAVIQPDYHIRSGLGDVEVTFKIDEGPLVHVGEILIIGNDQTRASTVRSALDIDAGDAYSRKQLLKGESTLRRLGAFASVDVDVVGLDEQLEIVHLLVRVEERKNYVIDLRVSYDTDDKASASLSFTDLDFLGYGKRMNVKGTIGFDLRRGEWNYIDPHLLGGDVEMIIGAFIQDEDRPSFQVTDLGGSLSFLREIGRTMSVLAKYEVERSSFRGGTPSPDDETEDRTFPHVTLSFNYDSRDYFADPRRGLFGLASFDYFHSLFGTGTDFFKLRSQLVHYITPTPRFTFVNSLRLEGIIPLKSSTVVPRTELLFMGGDYSIRGFDQDLAGPVDAAGTPVGQKFLFLLNTELQFRLGGKFKFAGFLDTASVAKDFDVSLTSLRHSAGFGLRYITPVGPIRLDYGFVLDRKPGEGVGRLHFTFGYVF